MTWSAGRWCLLACACFAICAALGGLGTDHALAQPFAMSRQPPAPDLGPLAGWILAKQAEFYRMLSGTIRAAKAHGTAAYTLLGISFLYGIFHAAGPGHGKAVISSYLVANDETWRRGVFLSFASAIFQALTAIAIVGIAAVLLNATAKTMGNTVRVVEIAGYAMIVLIGLRLLWVKGRALLALRPQAPAHHQHAHAHDDHAHAHHAHAHAHTHHHGHVHEHGETCEHEASAWGHAHAPEPAELGGKHWLRRGLAAVVAVGLRPCSGAIIVLVFALAQGLFWIGVAATFAMGLGTAITVAAIASLAVGARSFAGRLAKSKSGGGMLIVRALETAAALAIILFGVLLLTGYIVSERMVGV
jgi:nickel/cobalt exporter